MCIFIFNARAIQSYRWIDSHRCVYISFGKALKIVTEGHRHLLVLIDTVDDLKGKWVHQLVTTIQRDDYLPLLTMIFDSIVKIFYSLGLILSSYVDVLVRSIAFLVHGCCDPFSSFVG